MRKNRTYCHKRRNHTEWPAFRYVALTLAFTALLLFLIQTAVLNARVTSPSMEGTIMTGDRLIGSRLAYLTEDPQRFDVVIFYYPDDESQRFIKRVIGLPGETVEIRDGKVYIGESVTPLPDGFCPETPKGDFGPYQVPEDSYFVLGDNRNISRDSRYWNNPYVSRDKIIGKALFRYWPAEKAGMIR